MDRVPQSEKGTGMHNKKTRGIATALIHLDVKNVGTFDYDSNGRAALNENAHRWY